ncbi:hypothetical protein DB30_06026 [Enhygromyxa salina]|uniref:Uncharacterized protein n=1 Tax=Enhygromyxa salina TaxID=215803 RepID=A0A0C1ZVN6_9BACT|nr:hypothetical protein DB30_06026 [Enhygromyxa salina]
MNVVAGGFRWHRRVARTALNAKRRKGWPQGLMRVARALARGHARGPWSESVIVWAGGLTSLAEK